MREIREGHARALNRANQKPCATVLIPKTITTMAVDIDDLLLKRLPVPPCEGPKLKAFRHTPKETQFLRLLSCDPDSEESETGSGYVFEVGIGEKRFALKVVRHTPI